MSSPLTSPLRRAKGASTGAAEKEGAVADVSEEGMPEPMIRRLAAAEDIRRAVVSGRTR